jgi:tRNA pseudouridine32 synthase/23S rRNA pseudouridine746 synthase
LYHRVRLARGLAIAISGFCTACGTIHSLGDGNSRRHAFDLMARLEAKRCIDDGSDPRFSTDYLQGEARGQMFGVLECATAAGDVVVLRAFSSQYDGVWEVPGWVPPLLDVDAFQRITAPVDREIKALDRRIAEDGDPELVRERRALSQDLTRRIQGLYRLHNFRGETRPLTEVFPGGIPTGAGDCCAPKLLNHAARRGLHPVGISEFFWGRENRSGTRTHREFYPACAEKCQPILGFMLCGASVPIVYEDEDLVVVLKPSGLLAVPGRGPENRDCVVARIRALRPGCIEQPAVHRLDMDTSGLMVLARTAEAHRALSLQFIDRRIVKRYIALLDGEPAGSEGTIELPFRLDVDDRPRQIHDPVHGKVGITHWRKLSVEDGRTRVEFRPVTGRTHQLRVHAASPHGLGIPIVGDRLYGAGDGQGPLRLHAGFLGFSHPRTGERLEFRSEPAF